MQKTCVLRVCLTVFYVFGQAEKMRDTHASLFHQVLHRDLCYASENEGFCVER
jgi:hypothetical protein